MLWVAKLRDIDGEVRHTLDVDRETPAARRSRGADLGWAQPAEPRLRLGMDQHIELPKRQETALRDAGLRIKPMLITPLYITAVKRISSKYMWVHALYSSW